jgi:hypothetical protein
VHRSIAGGGSLLLRFDVGRPDDLAPFLGIVGDELAPFLGIVGDELA